ncbi:isochorismatase family protein [Patulibacter defluvii]|uniref:isochorismatase family protein n=1 Tax=Patulibacter defluvii TaxID=3095358 RepID=UPI002A74E645|nr:isochorismatase family protein [Patulibacter sp. DM4]
MSAEPNGTLTAEELDEVQDALRRLNEHNDRIYRSRGYNKRIGFGKSPAVVVVDLANAWTRDDLTMSCLEMPALIESNLRLLEVARSRGFPIVFTTMGYQVVDGPHSDAGMEAVKSPIADLKLGTDLIDIDERLGVRDDEYVIVKKKPSAFHGTHLSSLLRGAGVDTVIVTGVTASCCVRTTVGDAFSENFRAIVPRECVGDRIHGAVEYNLFDLDAKFADVESLETVIAEIEKFPALAAVG